MAGDPLVLIQGDPPMPITLAELVRRLNDRPPVSIPDVTRLGASLVGDVSGAIRRTIRALVPVTATDLLDDWFPWTRDQRLATDPSVPEDERMAAISRLATTVNWSPNPTWGKRELRASQELRARARAEERLVSDVKKEVLGKAVLLVLGDRGRFRRIRVGGGKGSFHLTEVEGGAREISPLDLPYSADPEAVTETHRRFAESPYLYWFRREVQKAAMAIILEEPYPPSTSGTEGVGDKRAASSVPLDEKTVADVRIDGDPHLQALSMEGYNEATMRLGPLLEQASPRQWDLLILLSEGATTAEAARTLGIAESTARVHLKRFRDKVSAV